MNETATSQVLSHVAISSAFVISLHLCDAVLA